VRVGIGVAGVVCVADGVGVAVVWVTGTTTTVRVTTCGGGFGRVWCIGVGAGRARCVETTVFTGGGEEGVVAGGAVAVFTLGFR
jgi:hypothetical protein